MEDVAARNARAGQHAVALVTLATSLDATKATPHETIVHATQLGGLIAEATRDVGTAQVIGALIGLTAAVVRTTPGADVAMHDAARRIAAMAARTT
jgi:hypothetical protein